MADTIVANSPTPVLEVGHECRLIGADPRLLAAIRQELTIENPKYQAAKQFGRWIGKQLKPQLFFYREEAGALVFPRGFGNQAVRICRRVLGVSPQLRDQRRLLDAIELSFLGELRPYQEQAVQAVLDHSFGVLEAGTGSGKTIMALAVIARRRQPTLILVHSKELMYQWQERIQQFLGVGAGLAGDGRLTICPLTVAIVNTAKKYLQTLPVQFGQVVVDECHRVPSSLFTEVVSAFDCRYMLGLSATAFRREDGMTRLIYIAMGERVHQVDSRLLAASGAVLRPELAQRSTEFNYGYQGEYAKLIQALAKDLNRNRQIIRDLCTQLASGHAGTVLLVSDRVEHCQVLADMLAEKAVPVAVLTGRTPPEERVRIVNEVRENQVQVLVSTLQLIGEGFDCPGLSTLVLATPIKFEGRLLQVVGRIMRPAEGKHALVIDYVDERIPVLRRSAASRRAVFLAW
ncbi:MAG: DEAD/DEAH box helicase [Desulfobulbus sp.]|nr:DEAD/DEAH box helicase [Desulfobulbus sp.]